MSNEPPPLPPPPPGPRKGSQGVSSTPPIGPALHEPPEDPPQRRRARETLHNIWARVPRVWKTLGLIGAIFGAGVAVTAYVDEKASGFVERSTFDETNRENKAERDELRRHITELQSQEAARDAELKAIKNDTSAMRDDVRQLLNFMLANPPARRQPP